MIEIVKEPTPVEKKKKVVEEPRNVRQIGTLPKDARVYVEDYVYRFFTWKQSPEETVCFYFARRDPSGRAAAQFIHKRRYGTGTDQVSEAVCRSFPRISGIGYTGRSEIISPSGVS